MPQPMLPESTEAKMIEEFQTEEDSRLFGMRNESSDQIISHVEVPEVSTHKKFDDFEENVFTEREKPRTRYHSPASTSNLQRATKESGISAELTNLPTEPPIFAWLADTEPPEDPDSVIKWREAEEVHRTKRQEENSRDIEVFRNVEITVPLRDDVPIRDTQDFKLSSHPKVDDPGSGAYMLYRKILDQYPKLEDPIAWRLANANWIRMGNIQEKQLANPKALHPMLNHPEVSGPLLANFSDGSDSSGKDNKLAYNALYTSINFTNPWKKRKICSLPPPPRPLRVDRSVSGYGVECYLCYQTINIRRKRDWRYISLEPISISCSRFKIIMSWMIWFHICALLRHARM
jgi:hypothetical protein